MVETLRRINPAFAELAIATKQDLTKIVPVNASEWKVLKRDWPLGHLPSALCVGCAAGLVATPASPLILAGCAGGWSSMMCFHIRESNKIYEKLSAAGLNQSNLIKVDAGLVDIPLVIDTEGGPTYVSKQRFRETALRVLRDQPEPDRLRAPPQQVFRLGERAEGQ